MNTDLRQPCGQTDLIDIGIHPCEAAQTLLDLHSRQSIVQGLYDGDSAAGGAIFCFLLLDHLVVFILDGGGLYGNDVFLQIYAAPVQGHDLGSPEAGQGQQRRDLNGLAADGIQKYHDLVGIQKGPLVWNQLWERHMDMLVGFAAYHRRNKAPGVLEGFGGAEPGFGIDNALPAGRCDGADPGVHDALKTGALDDAVAPDGAGGEHIFFHGDVVVNGLGDCFVATGLGLGLLNTGFDGHGFGDGFFFCGPGDGNVLAVDAQPTEPGPGGELFCSWCFQNLPCLSGAFVLP